MLTLSGVERSNAAAIDETIRNLSIRAEVGCIVESMLSDLEAWEWANKEEKMKKELENAKEQVEVLRESERVLLEREAEAAARASEERAIARDVRAKFVEELWGLTREFRVRDQEEAKVDQLSKELTRMEGVEAELREAERKLAKFQQAAAVATAEAALSAVSLASGGSTLLSEGGSPEPRSPDYGTGVGLDAAIHEPGRERLHRAQGAADDCPFLQLEKKPLLKIFVFLSAPEVLCAAQVCRRMFEKVDMMFGIGGQGNEPTPPSPSDGAKASAPVITSAGPTRSRASSTTSIATAPMSATPAGAASIGQRAFATALGAVVGRVEAVTSSASGSLSGLAGLTNGGEGVSASMSPEMMDGLSKRLTTAEMRGIIQLTDRGKKLEVRARTLQAEKEDLIARLQGTESVKEFLVSKLKETEAALKRSLDEKGLTLRQVASDQEVISFLDSKTQEMEKVAKETMEKAVTYQNELQNERISGQKQTKMLEDMLRFEKQQREAEEVAFKSQKKLLVAEVRKLRTANLARTAECDDLREQLKKLRQSVSQLRG